MKNILLIEDEDNLNRGISLKLQKEGYTVFSAATVAEGLNLFQANTIDLVICDIGLPDGSGLDLCASIRQKSDVLFLFLTALDTEVDMITGYENEIYRDIRNNMKETLLEWCLNTNFYMRPKQYRW